MRQLTLIRHRACRRRGNILALVAISLIALIGVTGLVIDGGYMMAERRHAQNASDAAALAGAIDLYKGKTSTQAQATALMYAGRNGYSNDGSTNTVTVNIPPTSGPHTANPNAVEVIANRSVKTSFIKVVYPSAASVTTRSVADMTKDSSLLVLNPTASGALTVSGSTTIDVSGGAITVDSSSSTAVRGSGSAQLTGNPIDMAGNYSISGTSKLVGTITTGATPTPDPLAALPAVDPNSLTLRSSTDLSFSGGTTTLQPGTYLGRITLSSSAAVTLQPGIYYVGNDFTLSGSSSIQANGVMIYAVGKFTASGSGTVAMTPPTSGTYKDVTLFKDRTSSSTAITLSGGSNMQISGTLYAKPSLVTISGSGGVVSAGSQIIADRTTITGSGTIKLSGFGTQQGVYLTE